MTQYIDKSTLSADIDKRKNLCEKIVLDLRTKENKDYYQGKVEAYKETLNFLGTIEVKDVYSMIHTIIAECCDWLAMNTNLSHDEIEDCRNLMLTVKEEQFKAQKGE